MIENYEFSHTRIEDVAKKGVVAFVSKKNAPRTLNAAKKPGTLGRKKPSDFNPNENRLGQIDPRFLERQSSFAQHSKSLSQLFKTKDLYDMITPDTDISNVNFTTISKERPATAKMTSVDQMRDDFTQTIVRPVSTKKKGISKKKKQNSGPLDVMVSPMDCIAAVALSSGGMSPEKEKRDSMLREKVAQGKKTADLFSGIVDEIFQNKEEDEKKAVDAEEVFDDDNLENVSDEEKNDVGGEIIEREIGDNFDIFEKELMRKKNVGGISRSRGMVLEAALDKCIQQTQVNTKRTSRFRTIGHSAGLRVQRMESTNAPSHTRNLSETPSNANSSSPLHQRTLSNTTDTSWVQELGQRSAHLRSFKKKLKSKASELATRQSSKQNNTTIYADGKINLSTLTTKVKIDDLLGQPIDEPLDERSYDATIDPNMDRVSVIKTQSEHKSILRSSMLDEVWEEDMQRARSKLDLKPSIQIHLQDVHNETGDLSIDTTLEGDGSHEVKNDKQKKDRLPYGHEVQLPGSPIRLLSLYPKLLELRFPSKKHSPSNLRRAIRMSSALSSQTEVHGERDGSALMSTLLSEEQENTQSTEAPRTKSSRIQTEFTHKEMMIDRARTNMDMRFRTFRNIVLESSADRPRTQRILGNTAKETEPINFAGTAGSADKPEPEQEEELRDLMKVIHETWERQVAIEEGRGNSGVTPAVKVEIGGTRKKQVIGADPLAWCDDGVEEKDIDSTYALGLIFKHVICRETWNNDDGMEVPDHLAKMKKKPPRRDTQVPPMPKPTAVQIKRQLEKQNDRNTVGHLNKPYGVAMMFGGGSVEEKKTLTLANHVPRIFSQLGAVVSMVCCGKDHVAMMVVTEDVFTFGSNEYGQLGVGKHVQRIYQPCHVQALDVPVKQIACGYYHTLALSSRTSHVHSWGRGCDGRLGHNSIEHEYFPRFIDNIRDKRCRSIHASGHFSAALSERGELYTWGMGSFGQLGHGTMHDYHTPSKVKFFKNQFVASVALGPSTCSCITRDGKLYMWGNAWKGQTARSDPTNCYIPTNLPLGNKKVAEMAIGYEHVLCLTDDNELYSWGHDKMGQLGREVTLSQWFNEGARVTYNRDMYGDIASISAGHHTSAIRTKKGFLLAWGANDIAQSGLDPAIAGNTVDQPSLVSAVCNSRGPFNTKAYVHSIVMGQGYGIAISEYVVREKAGRRRGVFRTSNASDVAIPEEKGSDAPFIPLSGIQGIRHEHTASMISGMPGPSTMFTASLSMGSSPQDSKQTSRQNSFLAPRGSGFMQPSLGSHPLAPKHDNIEESSGSSNSSRSGSGSESERERSYQPIVVEEKEPSEADSSVSQQGYSASGRNGPRKDSKMRVFRHVYVPPPPVVKEPERTIDDDMQAIEQDIALWNEEFLFAFMVELSNAAIEEEKAEAARREKEKDLSFLSVFAKK